VKRASLFLLGWCVELIILVPGVFVMATLGAVQGAWCYLRDVGFVARNIGRGPS
jgi:hypothetical protein